MQTIDEETVCKPLYKRNINWRGISVRKLVLRCYRAADCRAVGVGTLDKVYNTSFQAQRASYTS